MLTTNNDTNVLNKKSSIEDQLQSIIGRFQRKTIKKTKTQQKLATYAKTHGFLNNEYRKFTWKILVDSSSYENSHVKNENEFHRDYEQIKMDVIRTLKRFPPNYTDSERNQLQDHLIVIINNILTEHEELHYYQGYHDICLTFLLVLGEDLCFPVMNSITMSHLKYFMEPTMDKTRSSLSYLMPLIDCINSECAEYIEKGGVGHVIFALPWFITWYSHVLDDLDIILRLYDLFIVSDFLMPIYIAAEIVNYYADEVLSKDCDMAILHQFLSMLPTIIDRDTWEEIIKRALYLFDNHPPNTLERLNQEWMTKRGFIEESSNQLIFENRQAKPNRKRSISTKRRTLSYIAFWGVTVTVGGLAIYLWNQSQSLDPFRFTNLGDF